MGCCEGLAKCLLIIFNLLFVLCGIGLIGVGTWLKVDPSAWNYLHIAAYESDQLMQVTIWVAIGLGIFILVISGFGFLGACCNNSCMLTTYAVLVGLIIVAQLTVGILAVVFRNNIEGYLKDNLKTQVREEYQPYKNDTSMGSVLTGAWDFMQVKLDCCGCDGPSDWMNSKYRTETNHSVPLTCCVLETKDPDNAQPVDVVQCRADGGRANLTSSQYVHVEGCYDEMLDWIKSNSIALIGLGFGIIAVEILVIVFACCLRKEAEKDNYLA